MTTTRCLFVCIAGCIALTTACASKVAPRERYVKALNHKMDGDSKAYYDELIGVAHDEPDSRAGRRARATLQGGGLATTAAVIGVLAAIAVPNFLKFQGRSKQSEAKINLKGLFVAQKSYFAERQRYCTTFKQCGWSPDPGAMYIYFMSDKERIGGDAASDVDLLYLRAESTLAAMGVKPGVTSRGFLAVAVGDPDKDGQLDVWSIDENNNLVNLLNDLE